MISDAFERSKSHLRCCFYSYERKSFCVFSLVIRDKSNWHRERWTFNYRLSILLDDAFFRLYLVVCKTCAVVCARQKKLVIRKCFFNTRGNSSDVHACSFKCNSNARICWYLSQFRIFKKTSEICIWIHMRRTIYDKQSCVRMANNQVAGIIFLFVYWPLSMCIDYYDKFPVHFYVDYGMCVQFESMLSAMQNVAHLDSCPWLESYVHISVFEAIKRSPNKSFYMLSSK